MRFSDMMGSGEERTLPPSEIDSAISNALAPYLDEPVTAETAVGVETAVEAEPDTPAPRAHTVEAVFPVARVPVEATAPVAPVAQVEDPPVAVNESATAIADFTPLSDDLLPRRRR